MSDELGRELRYQAKKLEGVARMRAEDMLLRRFLWDSWPWWRKLIWKVFGR